MNADSISGISHLHFILFILSLLSKDSPTTFQCAAFKRGVSR